MKRFFVFVVALTVLGLQACKDDSDGLNDGTTGSIKASEKAQLLDKVWYTTNSGGGVPLEWLSDGIYREAKSLEGTWTWRNNGDTMDAVDYTGRRFSYLFESIGSNQITFRFNRGGDNFGTLFTYKDTE